MSRPVTVLLVCALALLASACGDSTEPPEVTTVVVSPASTTLEFLGDTVQLNAEARDRNDQPLEAFFMWSSSNPNVVSVSASGLATALRDGAATITAATGGVTGTATVDVDQVPVLMNVVAGDGQTGIVGSVLAADPTVELLDRGRSPVPDVEVSFEVLAGGGSVSPSSRFTDGLGQASTRWTLGGEVDTDQRLRASRDDLEVEFTARGRPGAAARIAKVSGDGQTGVAGDTLPDPLVVQVTDEFGHPTSGPEITFTVVSGGGSFVGAGTSVTDAPDDDGLLQFRLILGPTPGENRVEVTSPGLEGSPLTFTATGT